MADDIAIWHPTLQDRAPLVVPAATLRHYKRSGWKLLDDLDSAPPPPLVTTSPVDPDEGDEDGDDEED